TAEDGGQYEAAIPVAGTLAVGEGARGLDFEAPQPNPAFASVRLAGAVTSIAALDLFDIGGRRVQSFVVEAGRFDLDWNLADAHGRRVPAGLYFARLASAEGVRSQR